MIHRQPRRDVRDGIEPQLRLALAEDDLDRIENEMRVVRSRLSRMASRFQRGMIPIAAASITLVLNGLLQWAVNGQIP